MPGRISFNHVGHCVTDIARSRRFYEELLGFRFEREIHPPDHPSDRLLRIDPPLGVTAVYLRRDGLLLELLCFDRPGNPAFRPRVMNEPGLTHVSISVEDVNELIAHLNDYGGEMLSETDVGGGTFFIRDPDGQLLEILPIGYRESVDLLE